MELSGTSSDWDLLVEWLDGVSELSGDTNDRGRSGSWLKRDRPGESEASRLKGHQSAGLEGIEKPPGPQGQAHDG